MKSIPLLSLTLLLISYSILGWNLANTQVSLLLYLLVIASIFLLDAILTFSFLHFKAIIPWFNSEVYTFISAIATAFLLNAMELIAADAYSPMPGNLIKLILSFGIFPL